MAYYCSSAGREHERTEKRRQAPPARSSRRHAPETADLPVAGPSRLRSARAHGEGQAAGLAVVAGRIGIGGSAIQKPEGVAVPVRDPGASEAAAGRPFISAAPTRIGGWAWDRRAHILGPKRTDKHSSPARAVLSSCHHRFGRCPGVQSRPARGDPYDIHVMFVPSYVLRRSR